MVWTDQLRPASFRQVPFLVDSADREGGRRVVVHELVSRPIPIVEDLGIATKRHAISGYVVGDDVQAQRDRLIRALETPGTGTLIHPYLGSLSVSVESLRVLHTTREGRVARFGIVFVESDVPGTQVVESPRAQVLESSSALQTAARDDWTERSTLEGIPDWTLESALGEYGSVLDRLRAVDLSSGPFPEVAALVRLIDQTGDALADVARGGGWPEAIQDAIDQIEEAVGSREAALEVYLGLDDFRGSPASGLSRLGRIADENALANEDLLRALALAAAVRVAADIDWASLEDALAARDRISARLDALADRAGDETYFRIVALRARLSAAVPIEEESLPRIQIVRLAATTSSILLAYRIFGDASRESEIVARNRPPWPGLLSPSDLIEVLVDPS